MSDPIHDDFMKQEFNRVLPQIPDRPQVQYATGSQLELLRQVGIKLGLYDASDVIAGILQRRAKR